jgi:hypothetical protein
MTPEMFTQTIAVAIERRKERLLARLPMIEIDRLWRAETVEAADWAERYYHIPPRLHE